jgi:hypothetical protein
MSVQLAAWNKNRAAALEIQTRARGMLARQRVKRIKAVLSLVNDAKAEWNRSSNQRRALYTAGLNGANARLKNASPTLRAKFNKIKNAQRTAAEHAAFVNSRLAQIRNEARNGRLQPGELEQNIQGLLGTHETHYENVKQGVANFLLSLEAKNRGEMLPNVLTKWKKAVTETRKSEWPTRLREAGERLRAEEAAAEAEVARAAENARRRQKINNLVAARARLRPINAALNGSRQRNTFGIRGLTQKAYEANLERTKARGAEATEARKSEQERLVQANRKLYSNTVLKTHQKNINSVLSNLEKTRKNISKLGNNAKIKAAANNPTDELKALKKELENAEAENARRAEKFKNLIENPPANAYKSRMYMGSRVQEASRELVQARKRVIGAHAKYYTELAKVAAGGNGALAKQKWQGVVNKIKKELKAAREAPKPSVFAKAAPPRKGFALNALAARKKLNASVYAARKERAEEIAKLASDQSTAAQKAANSNAKEAVKLAKEAEELARAAAALKSYKPEMTNPSKKSGTQLLANQAANKAAKAAAKANQSKQTATKAAEYAKKLSNQVALWTPNKARTEAMKKATVNQVAANAKRRANAKAAANQAAANAKRRANAKAAANQAAANAKRRENANAAAKRRNAEILSQIAAERARRNEARRRTVAQEGSVGTIRQVQAQGLRRR